MMRLLHLRLLLPAVALALLGLTAALGYSATRQLEHGRTQRTVITLTRERLTQLQITAELFLKLGLTHQMQQLIAGITAEPDLQQVMLVGPNDRILAANRLALVGEDWHQVAPDLAATPAEETRQTRSIHMLIGPQGRYVDSYAPLCGAVDPTLLRDLHCGFIAYRVDLEYHYAATDQALTKQAAYFWAGVLGISLVLLVLLHLLVARRAGRIVTTLRRFDDGQRGARIPGLWPDEIGEIGSTVNHVLDQIQQQERDLLDQRERLRAIFDAVTDSIIIIDARGIIQSVNPATERLFGYDQGELLGRNVGVLMPAAVRAEHDGYIARYLETGERRVIGVGREVEAVTKQGEVFAAEAAVSEMTIGGQRMFTGVLRDVSERVRVRETMEQVNAELLSTNQQLWHSAKTDSLTGLANRSHFDQTLRGELQRAVRQGTPLSLVMLDLDYFKAFNDHYGHYDGDSCLQAFAQVLRDSCQRNGELAARYGGEEFAVILPLSDPAGAVALAERMRQSVEALHLPHADSAIADWVTTSIGVATYLPNLLGPVDERHLIQAADRALYQAKAEGRNRVVALVMGNEDAQPGEATES